MKRILIHVTNQNWDTCGTLKLHRDSEYSLLHKTECSLVND